MISVRSFFLSFSILPPTADPSPATRRTASLDGFAYNKYGWRGAHGWPGFAAGDDPSGRDDLKAKDEVRRRVCTIKRD